MKNLKQISMQRYLIIGTIATFAVLIFLQAIQPYYFTRNDNIQEFLPTLNAALDQAFKGQIPFINMHQNMGAPILEMGYYPIFDPVILVSHIFSKYILRNIFFTFEIYSSLYIIISFIATYFLIKELTGNDSISMIGSLSYIFSGYSMILLHDWFYIAPTMVFLPLLLWFHTKYANHKIKSGKWFLMVGILRSLYFYSGNLQCFTYTALFELIYIILIWSRQSAKKQAFTEYIKSWIICIILSLPMLILTGQMKAVTSREFSIGGYLITNNANLYDFIIGNTFPAFLRQWLHIPVLNSANINLYYSNVILFICFAIISIWSFRKHKMKITYIEPFVILGLLCVTLSFGIWGLIYPLMVIVPVWHNFIWPIKLTLWTNLFIAVSGSICLVKLISEKSKKRISIIIYLIILITIIGILLQLPVYSKSNTSYRDNLPPAISFPDEMQEGKIITIVTSSDSSDRFASLASNYPTIFSLCHVNGYEHLIPKLNKYILSISRYGFFEKNFNCSHITQQKLSEYGIRWIITDKQMAHECNFKWLNAKYYLEHGNIIIFENQKARPLVFFDNSNAELTGNIKSSYTDNGIMFNITNSVGSDVILNVIYNPSYKLYIDEEKSRFEPDSFGRIKVFVPKGKHSMVLTYKRDSFFIGIVLSIILFILFMLFINPIGKLIKQCISILIPTSKKASELLKKHYIIFTMLILVIVGIYSVMQMEQQKFLGPVIACTKDSLSSINTGNTMQAGKLMQCFTEKHDQEMLKKECAYLKKSGILHTLLYDTDNIC